MNEATITRELCQELIRRNGGGPVIKHAEKALIGLPDLSITGGHATQWIEVKYVPYHRPKVFSLRKIVGFGGPQYRLLTSLDYHGTGAHYVLFFHNPDTRDWQTWLTAGVLTANLCNLDTQIDLGVDGNTRSQYLWTGKAWDHIWEALQRRRKEYDAL